MQSNSRYVAVMLGLIRRLWRWWLGRRAIPADWVRIVEAEVPFAATLSGPTRARFLRHLPVFARSQRFVGADEMTVDDRVRVVVSAAAVRLVLHLDLSYYDHVRQIVIVPQPYQRPGQKGGIAGEAHDNGVVVLAWEAVLAGLADQSDGRDTAMHEFAHLLDAADGAFDGTPPLKGLSHYRPWAEVMGSHFQALRRGTRSAGPRPLLRRYGATNEAEFFAVATEAFFETPGAFKRRAPELYRELRRFYQIDPAEPGSAKS